MLAGITPQSYIRFDDMLFSTEPDVTLHLTNKSEYKNNKWMYPVIHQECIL